MTVILDDVLSVLIYIVSFIVFSLAIYYSAISIPKWFRKVLIVILAAIILGVSIFELPPRGLPFWSRDFSLTWQLIVLLLATIVVSMSKIFLKVDGQFGSNIAPYYAAMVRGAEYYPDKKKHKKLRQETQSGGHHHRTNSDGNVNRIRYLLLILVGAILLVAYLNGATRQLTNVNKDKFSADQSSYMRYAMKMAKSDYSHVGDRNRMPVYPFIQSLFYLEGMDDDDFFTQGKYINLILSILIIFGLSLVLYKHLGLLWTFILVLISGFTVFIFKAGWFQAELLFYFINFVLFILFIKFIKRPGIAIAVWLGIMSGYAHLTKASILPGLILFMLVLLFGIVRRIFKGRNLSTEEFKINIRTSLNSGIYLVIIISFYLLVIFPYIKNSWYRFGSPFYNVNSTFYMWYDSWNEAKWGTNAHWDSIGWPDMPEDSIPSVSNYLSSHSTGDIIQRVTDGAKIVISRVYQSYGYHKYILLLSVMLLVGIVLNRDRVRYEFRVASERLIFIILYFAIYFLLYFWYAPIASGNRLILAQFLPLLFILSIAVITLLRNTFFRFRSSQNNLSTLAAIMVILMIGIDVWLVLTDRIGMFGGA